MSVIGKPIHRRELRESFRPKKSRCGLDLEGFCQGITVRLWQLCTRGFLFYKYFVNLPLLFFPQGYGAD